MDIMCPMKLLSPTGHDLAKFSPPVIPVNGGRESPGMAGVEVKMCAGRQEPCLPERKRMSRTEPHFPLRQTLYISVARF
jgi:hypothetical protein